MTLRVKIDNNDSEFELVPPAHGVSDYQVFVDGLFIGDIKLIVDIDYRDLVVGDDRCDMNYEIFDARGVPIGVFKYLETAIRELFNHYKLNGNGLFKIYLKNGTGYYQTSSNAVAAALSLSKQYNFLVSDIAEIKLHNRVSDNTRDVQRG